MSKGFRQLIEEGNIREYIPLTIENVKEYMTDIFRLKVTPKTSIFRRMCDKVFTKQPEWARSGIYG